MHPHRFAGLVQTLLLAVTIVVVAVAQPSGEIPTAVDIPASYDRDDLLNRIPYPPKALKGGFEGFVYAKALVDVRGVATMVYWRLDGDSVLGDAVHDAITGTLFTPAIKDGRAVDSWLPIVVRYSMAASRPTPAKEGNNDLIVWVPRDLASSIDDATLASDAAPEFDMADLGARVVYPDEAKRLEIQGTVRVRALVDTVGTVLRALVESSDDDRLEHAALEAIRQSRFHPAAKFGRLMNTWVIVPVTFRLSSNE